LESDLKAEKELKFNPELARMSKKWIQDATGDVSEKSLVEYIKSGVQLCK
jgi:hypothetical protein